MVQGSSSVRSIEFLIRFEVDFRLVAHEIANATQGRDAELRVTIEYPCPELLVRRVREWADHRDPVETLF